MKENSHNAIEIPPKIIGYVHGTTAHAVRSAKSKPTRILKVYEETEQLIIDFVEDLRQKQAPYLHKGRNRGRRKALNNTVRFQQEG